ncbi:uncharacterized protein LOC62_07G009416 [Vanrija pseudolonga]|uniref:Uncharacterized protein n=1 Tax=Vanrija pseudolonga TaxID=143232 RepID=A0AAF0YFS5_9TREE|nr:hypothetical protein LOC62_07G009416 [Vanrija pseudolonga]
MRTTLYTAATLLLATSAAWAQDASSATPEGADASAAPSDGGFDEGSASVAPSTDAAVANATAAAGNITLAPEETGVAGGGGGGGNVTAAPLPSAASFTGVINGTDTATAVTASVNASAIGHDTNTGGPTASAPAPSSGTKPSGGERIVVPGAVVVAAILAGVTF